MYGVFAYYKPKGISSYDVIRKLKEIHDDEKIGHGGTLDPLAEGVLVIAVGEEYTRQLQTILKDTKKVYVAEIELGKTSVTDDSEGPFTITDNVVQPTREQIQEILTSFIGETEQTPPFYSAIKIKGRRAYRLARKGKVFTIKPKMVTIYNIRLIEYSYPFIKIEVECASGVYIRSIARDIGEKLQTGAYLKNLLRTAVGDFTVDKAIKL